MRTYALVTFGCQMNQHDSDRIGEVLAGMGYEPRESPEQADLVLLNTCSVREKAEQKLRSEVGRLGMLKAKRPELVIGIAGCVAQQEGERLVKRMPQIDLVIGPDRIADLPRVLAELELGAPPQVSVGFDVAAPRFLSAEPGPGVTKVTAFVTVMKGCDERCSFCIVPTTRGPERYRPARELVEEISRLVAGGVREVTLLGQTVNSYRDPESSFAPREAADESEFPALLQRIIERVPELTRLRYTSPHPRHLTPSLIAAHRDLPVLVRHVHLPFQSGSDRVLKRMIRRYTAAEYRERVAALREAVPAVTLSTDAIVGFPGETREDFEKTLELVDAVKFTGLFGFKYSPRPGTPALKLGDDVSEEEKSARLSELFELADSHRRAHLAALVGSLEEVLVEGPGRGKGKEFVGRTERNEIVHVEAGDRDPTGHVVRVRIDRAYKNSLYGTLPDDSPALPPRRQPAKHGPRALPVLG
jgi:tRNA-2-methylthio-N6-dimethylallyladenosine synthase